MGKKEHKKRKREKGSDPKEHKKKKKKTKKREEIADVWIEAPNPLGIDSAPIVEQKEVGFTSKQREEWMTTNPKREFPRPSKDQPEPVIENVYKPLELNPTYNPTLPQEKKIIEKPMTVGDGGNLWRRKAMEYSTHKVIADKTEELKSRPSQSRAYTEERKNYPAEVVTQSPREALSEYTEDELNLPIHRIKAMELKAKLRNDTKEQERMKKLLQMKEKGETVQLLSGLDQRGKLIKRIHSETPSDLEINKKKPIHTEFSEKGDRNHYFVNDQRDQSIKELLEEEKLNAQNPNELAAMNIIKNTKYKEPNIQNDEEYSTKLYEDKTSSLSKDKYEEMMKDRQIKADTYHQKLIDECTYCYDGTKINKRLLISIGDYNYLSLPQFGQLVPGHCIIVPFSHSLSLRTCDENTYEEIQLFKKYLVRMYKSHNMEPVFFESAINFRKQYHTYLECVPLPLTVAYDAPMFFSKEISDIGSKWATNPKLIKCTKGLRKSIPESFEYFYVSFANGQEFAHLIEDTKKFDSAFGRELVAGMLDLPFGKHIRKRKLDDAQALSLVKTFLTMWKPFDFTQYLEGGEFAEGT